MTLAQQDQLRTAAAAAGSDEDLSSIATHFAGSEHAELRALLAAAADPVRLSILALLREPRSVLEICTHLGLAQPRASHHLGVLRGCGLVTVRADGRRRFYAWAPGAGTGPLADVQALLHRWLSGGSGASPTRPQETGTGTPARSSPGTVDPVPQPFDDFLL